MEFLIDILHFGPDFVEGAKFALGPLAIQGIATGAGFLANRFLNPGPGQSDPLGIGTPERPEIPDLQDPIRDAFEGRRSMIASQAQEQAQDVEDDIAAQGLTGTAAAQQREAQIDAANRALQEVNAAESEALAQAAQREEELEFRQGQQQFQTEAQRAANRSQGIANLVDTAGQFALNRQLLGDQGMSINEQAELDRTSNILQQAGLGFNQGNSFQIEDNSFLNNPIG